MRPGGAKGTETRSWAWSLGLSPRTELGPWYGQPMSPATLTPPRERARRGTGTGLGRAWRVIVLNDDHNTFQGVAYALSSVLPGVSYDKGMSLANRIHDSGQAIVWSGEKEPAELYWTQLKDFGLTMAPLEQ
jgi:ATP-dependent Clp protease adaptor protein ClpS